MAATSGPAQMTSTNDARPAPDAAGRAVSLGASGAEATPGADAPGARPDSGAGDSGPVPVGREGLSTLLRRGDFVAASRAQRWSMPGLVMQARRRRDDEPATGARIGYTCSKKVGNAVARNRAKRRLRAAAAEAMPGLALAGWDYVLIGRHEATAARDFRALVADVRESLDRLHAGKGRDSGPPKARGGRSGGKSGGKSGGGENAGFGRGKGGGSGA